MIDRILKIVHTDPEDGIKVISPRIFDGLNIDINSNMILLDINKNNVFKVKDILIKIYGKDYEIKIICDIDEEMEYTIPIEKVVNYALGSNNIIFIPKIDKRLKRLYDFFDIMGIMKILRGEKGCPWDKKQNHKSIRQSIIEEAYEVVDAIDQGDKEGLKEELGDLFFQVAFHSQIATENGDFTSLDVTSALANKLIYRHPHVFLEKSVENTDEVVYNWNKLKYENRQITTLSGKLKDIAHLPALMYSYKVQEKAADVGFDWDSITGAIEKVYEELEEVMEVINVDNEKTEEELGDLLFAIVNLARFLNINPETALNLTIKKFINRLTNVEEKALGLGKELENMSLEEMDILWDEVKSEE